jgi:hypothetical protein
VDDATTDGRVVEALRSITAEGGTDPALTAVRARLGDVSRPDLDASLLRLDRAGVIQLEPNPHRFQLTPADHQSAVHLGGEDMHLAYLRKEPAVRPDPQQVIRDTYSANTSRPLEFISLTKIREALADHGFTRDEQDAALKKAMRSDSVSLEPEPFGHRVGNHGDAGIKIGGEVRHLIQMDQPAGDSPKARRLPPR